MSKRSAMGAEGLPGPLLHTAHWQFGPFELDEQRRELRLEGAIIELEPKPLNALMLLLRHPGELVTKADLLEAIWAGRIVTDSVITACMGKLRAALGDRPGAHLVTVHGYGYRLEANPTWRAAQSRLQESAAKPAIPDRAKGLAAGSPAPGWPGWTLQRRVSARGETWLIRRDATEEARVLKLAQTARELSALKREVAVNRLLMAELGEAGPLIELLDWQFDAPPWSLLSRWYPLGSLDQWLERQGGVGSLPLDTRLRLVEQLAEALAAVHEAGVLHKDLKPANVLVSRLPGRPLQLRLGDFGSSRLLDYTKLEQLAITRLGFSQFGEAGSSTTGTPLYYAPEVLSGQAPSLKSDIYALGVIFYQLVVGDMRRLFAPGWEYAVPDPLLRADIAACAAGDPAQRLSSARELAQRLRQLEQRREAQAQAEASQRAVEANRQALQVLQQRKRLWQVGLGVLGGGLLVSSALGLRAYHAQQLAQASQQRSAAVTQFLLRDVLGQLVRNDTPAQRLSVVELMETAAQRAPASLGHDSALHAEVSLEVVRALNQLGARSRAPQLLDQALGKLTAQVPPETQALIGAWALYLEVRTGQPIRELSFYLALERQLAKALPPPDANLLGFQVKLASRMVNRGEVANAKALLDRLRPATEGVANTAPMVRFDARYLDANLALGYGDPQAALSLMRFAVPLAPYAANTLESARIVVEHADFLQWAGRPKEALAMIEGVWPTLAAWESPPGDNTAHAYVVQGEAAAQLADDPRADAAAAWLSQYLATPRAEDPNRMFGFVLTRHLRHGALDAARTTREAQLAHMGDVTGRAPSREALLFALPSAQLSAALGLPGDAQRLLAYVRSALPEAVPPTNPLKVRLQTIEAALQPSASSP